MNLFVTQEAEQDLDQIEEYIGRDNPVAALKYIQRLTDRVEQLAVYIRELGVRDRSTGRAYAAYPRTIT